MANWLDFDKDDDKLEAEGGGYGQVGGGLNFGPVAEGGRVGSLEQALGAAGPSVQNEIGVGRTPVTRPLPIMSAAGQEPLARRPFSPVPFSPVPEQPLTGPQPPVRGPQGGRILSEGVPAGQGGYGIPDIDELRAEPWTTEFEQAALARADELVAERYNALRQQRAEEMARRGVTPDSPFYMSEMRKVDAEQARELSNFRRNLQVEKIDRRQRNLREARSVESLVDAMERQRLSELYSMVSGMPYQADPNIAALLAQQGALAQQGQADLWGGIGDLAGEWLRGQRQPVNINLGSSNPTGIGLPWYIGGQPSQALTDWQRWASNISEDR